MTQKLLSHYCECFNISNFYGPILLEKVEKHIKRANETKYKIIKIEPNMALTHKTESIHSNETTEHNELPTFMVITQTINFQKFHPQ